MNQDFEKLRNSNLDIEDIRKIRDQIKNIKINVLLIGATGVGKSSTINALFSNNGSTEPVAKVGENANPETINTHSYHLDNMVIWDTPGLGDSKEKDQQHQKKIIDLLQRKDEKGNPLIDLILLILDGSSRDFGSAYKLIEEVVAPNLHDTDKDRLLIGINKADKVKHHKYWNEAKNQPTNELIKILEEQSNIVKQRIQENNGFNPDVIYYVAGEIENGDVHRPPYNLQKLLSFIIEKLPQKKRIAIADKINKNEENFQSNDDKEDYKQKIEKSFFESLKEIASDVLQMGKELVSEIFQKAEIKDLLVSTGVKFVRSFFKK